MKNLLIGIAVGFGFSVAFFTLMANPRTTLAPPEMSYSQFIADVDGGKIEEVTFQGSKIVGRFTTGHTFRTLAPHSQLLPALTDRCAARGRRAAAASVDMNRILYLSLRALVCVTPIALVCSGLASRLVNDVL